MSNLGGGALAARVGQIRGRVEAAARRVGRDPAAVEILPVSKTQPLAALQDALAAGFTAFGENRLQELRDKAAALNAAHLCWHLIGPLQSNKVNLLARLAAQHRVIFQALCDAEIAFALQRRLQSEGGKLEVFIEINTSLEASKHGLPAEMLEAFLRQIRACDALKVVGLMTLAAPGGGEAARASFAQLAECRRTMQDKNLLPPNARLSMGMSGDFELAIEQGADLVRIGAAIFGERTSRNQAPAPLNQT